MLNVEIDGNKLQVPEGTMVIEAADEAGITIPRFCYHKKLSVAANCRMCLVEVEKAPKPLPACATPVTEGMCVFTRSTKAIDAQKSVMEFLLINHPLDCPVCDQGGECELQDIAMGYGKDVSRFSEGKRIVRDKDIGPLISTEMTRCIHCTRCVRFGQEVAGIMELGATGRGDHMRIGTYVERAVTSEMSGNVIDLCPVGALTSKPYRYRGRPWEYQSHDSISAHDCIGSNVVVQARRNELMRVLPRENEAINETWISDRDRFSYPSLAADDRLQQPMIKQGDEWKTVDWQTALNYAVEGVNLVVEKNGPQRLGALLSPSSTLEEMYLLQKLVRALGSNNIDHRLRQQDFSDQDIAPVFPWLGQDVAELENVDAALLIGSCVRKDQPIVAHRLRKAALKGAKIMAINAIDYDFNFPMSETRVVSPGTMLRELAAVTKALLTLTGATAPDGLPALLENVEINEDHTAMAKHLHSAEKVAVLLGTQAMSQNELSALRAFANVIAEFAGAKLGYLSEGANGSGAWLAGAVPHRGAGGVALDAPGKHVGSMTDKGIKAFFLMNMEPEFDCANPAAASYAVDDADFVVCFTPFVTEAMKAYADVLLPVAAFSETSGTFVNAEGRWQSFNGAVEACGETRPAWKVLRVLGNLFKVEGFDYLSSEEVRDELAGLCAEVTPSSASAWRCPVLPLPQNGGLMRIGHLPIYAVDMLVRRAQPLQDTADAIVAAIYMNEDTARKAGLLEAERATAQQGEQAVDLPLVIDEAVPNGCVMIPSAVKGSRELGAAYGAIEIRGQ